MAPPTITLHKRERQLTPPFTIIRLAGSGAGEAKEGETYQLTYRGDIVAEEAKVLAARDVAFGELTEEDAEALLKSGEGSLRELRLLLRKLYRARPYWDEERTVLRILTISY